MTLTPENVKRVVAVAESVGKHFSKDSASISDEMLNNSIDILDIVLAFFENAGLEWSLARVPLRQYRDEHEQFRKVRVRNRLLNLANENDFPPGHISDD